MAELGEERRTSYQNEAREQVSRHYFERISMPHRESLRGRGTNEELQRKRASSRQRQKEKAELKSCLVHAVLEISSIKDKDFACKRNIKRL